MNWTEFRSQLARELTARGVPDAEAVLKDFDEHFEEATRAGQSEQEICEMLGEPSEIAEQCMEDAKADAERPQATGAEGEIYVHLTSANLVLEPCAGKEFDVRVERRGLLPERNDPEAEVLVERSDKSLLVKQVSGGDLLSHILGGLDIKTVTIGVPATFDGIATIRIRSGNLRMEGIRKIRSFTAEITSGNTSVTGLGTDTMSLRSRSGSIRTTQCTGSLTAHTTSGNVHVEAHHGNVNASAGSGGVHVETDVINQSAAFRSVSGGVKLQLERLEADLQLKCGSGNIKFEIQNLHGNVTATTTSGNVTAHLGEDTQAVFSLRPGKGKNEFPEHPPDSKLPVVTLSSGSGMVRVKRI